MGPRLPLQQLLEALIAWHEAPTPGSLDAVRDALGFLTTTAAVDGAWLELDAPPLARLAVATGTLRDGDAAVAGAAGDPATLETVAVTVGSSRAPTGRVTVQGEAAARSPAIRALLLALDLLWSRAEAHISELRVTALDDATRAVAGELDLERVLQVIVDRVRPIVGARYAALGTLGPDGRFERFITSGVTPEERARIGPIPTGLGLLGYVVHAGRSVHVDDLATDPRRYGFPPHHPEMHSFLGVPVTVMGTSVGHLYLTEKEDADGFTEADQRLVETFARHAAISIERARLHAQVQHLAIADERERIARDLHDGIIQSLYAVGLSLEDVPELMDSDRQEALARLDRSIDSIHATIRDIRQFIVGLQPESLASGELDAAMETLAEEARQHGMANVYLEVTDAGSLTPLQATDVIQVAREAISNAVRHSGAARLRIRLQPEGDAMVLTVEDDGRGFDTALDPGPDHHGLANLNARARRLGGEVHVESSVGWGTRVTLTVRRGV